MKGIQSPLGWTKPDEKTEPCTTRNSNSTGCLTAQLHLLQTFCCPELTFTHSLSQVPKEHVILGQSKRGFVPLQCWLRRKQILTTQQNSPVPSLALHFAMCTIPIESLLCPRQWQSAQLCNWTHRRDISVTFEDTAQIQSLARGWPQTRQFHYFTLNQNNSWNLKMTL